MKRKAIIFGISGYKLSNQEKILIKREKPWGIILFSRNIKNLSQLRNLTDEIRKILKDNFYPILIDQEGGKVSRLNKIIDLRIFSQDYFSNLYKKNKNLFFVHYKIYIDTISNLLVESGININTVPVLDVRRKNSHNIIGTRSFSTNPSIISTLGKYCINFYKKNNIGTVSKHIPGHGLSMHDTHHKKSLIKESKINLYKYDFKPFKSCKTFFAMTAHLVYEKLDSANTATHSKIVIKKIIRRYIGFKGILISDDISMKALTYSLEENATKALKAGCNVILHCNGNMKEMLRLCKVVPKIDKFTKKKTSQFYKFLR